MATTHETIPTTNQDNGLAIASMVLGILSITGFGFLLGIPAIVLGAISLKNKTNKQRGLGISGLVMGIVGTVFSVLVIAFILLLAIFSTPNQQAPTHYHTLNNTDDQTFFTPNT